MRCSGQAPTPSSSGRRSCATRTRRENCRSCGMVEAYMGSVDVKRQSLNVFRMRLLGAAVHEVSEGTRTLKDAINEALRDWVTNVATTYYLLGSVVGPHPYPTIVRDFQSVIGGEIW